MNKSCRGVSVMKKLSLFASVALLLSGCGLMDSTLPMDAEYLSDIAYDAAPRTGYTVYLQEYDEQYADEYSRPAGMYFPYLVLTNDYGSNTLLLRRDIHASHTTGIRPAFCLSPETPLTTDDTIIPGESVYVIDFERLSNSAGTER
ncbi:MAG: hypothetical protein LBL37_00615 [Gracilibacteraceae bacterium]|jgi:hypothetical protein|nr:hypothetical protein [Gracilibacteraceae bacterium]